MEIFHAERRTSGINLGPTSSRAGVANVISTLCRIARVSREPRDAAWAPRVRSTDRSTHKKEGSSKTKDAGTEGTTEVLDVTMTSGEEMMNRRVDTV